MRILFALALFLPLTASAGGGRVPVLAELFTSDGCVNCPAADELLATLAAKQSIAGVEVIPLEWHVDSFNTDNWSDPFTLPDAHRRQNDFLAANDPHSMLYTPMLTVDGAAKTSGKEEQEIRSLLGAARSHKRVALAVSVGKGDLVTLRFATLAPDSSLYAAVTESQLAADEKSGPNAGQQWKRGAVVRQYTRLTEASAGSTSAKTKLMIAPEWNRRALSIVAWIQGAQGHVLGVARTSVPKR
jgi:hypothetical protein